VDRVLGFYIRKVKNEERASLFGWSRERTRLMIVGWVDDCGLDIDLQLEIKVEKSTVGWRVVPHFVVVFFQMKINVSLQYTIPILQVCWFLWSRCVPHLSVLLNFTKVYLVISVIIFVLDWAISMIAHSWLLMWSNASSITFLF